MKAQPPNDTGSEAISDLLTPFLATLSARSGSTRRAYLADLRTVCAWYERRFGTPLTLKALTVDVVLRYRQWCRARVRAGTFNRRKAALSAFCQWAIGEGYVSGDPIRSVAGAKW